MSSLFSNAVCVYIVAASVFSLSLVRFLFVCLCGWVWSLAAAFVCLPVRLCVSVCLAGNVFAVWLSVFNLFFFSIPSLLSLYSPIYLPCLYLNVSLSLSTHGFIYVFLWMYVCPSMLLSRHQVISTMNIFSTQSSNSSDVPHVIISHLLCAFQKGTNRGSER